MKFDWEGVHGENSTVKACSQTDIKKSQTTFMHEPDWNIPILALSCYLGGKVLHYVSWARENLIGEGEKHNYNNS